MDERTAIEALAGLAQEHRLRVFRLLVREGPVGLPAGEIALRLGVPPSTMSSHLAQLERAGLLRSRRDQRRIIMPSSWRASPAARVPDRGLLPGAPGDLRLRPWRRVA